MSRYLILLILNTPLIAAAILNALIDYKLGKFTRKRFLIQLTFWILIFAGLASAQTIYEFLFDNNLTRTETLSLFDVIQITGIVVILFIANRSRTKIELLERRVQDLHQELSIKLSEMKKPEKS